MTLVACLLITAPYGRYSTSKGWGPLVPAQLAWFLMESPNLWIPLLFWSTDNAPKLAEKALPNCILLLFFVLHYFHRAVIYPLRMQARIAAPMPVSVAFLAFAFCCWNGLNQSIALTLLQEYPEGYETHPRFLCGMAIAATGMALNIHADTHLLNLRKDPSDRTYKIPRGGLFELVRYFIVLSLSPLSHHFHSLNYHRHHHETKFSLLLSLGFRCKLFR